jgi:hypothetical protein
MTNDGPLPQIGTPATRVLAAQGITRLADLTHHRSEDLLALHGVGPKESGYAGRHSPRGGCRSPMARRRCDVVAEPAFWCGVRWLGAGRGEHGVVALREVRLEHEVPTEGYLYLAASPSGAHLLLCRSDR